MTNYQKVDEALASGRIWRAKEILQGRLRGAPYDSELYRRYGEILLEMQDLLEAGRYLFLSGVRAPAYTEAIGAFLERHGCTAATLHGAFPSCLKGAGVSKVPACLWEELGERGIDIAALKKLLSRDPKGISPVEVSFGSRAVEVGIGVMLVALLVALLAGLVIQSMRGLAWLGEKIGLLH